MNLHLNHTRKDSAATSTSEVVGTLLALLEDGTLSPAQFARMQIHLDWIQYKENFREAVMAMHNAEDEEGGAPLEIHIDGRQVAPGGLRGMVQNAINSVGAEARERPDRIYLEDFRSFRSSVAWDFNRLYWWRLKDWEQATGKGYEEMLPGGKSDGHQPEAIAESVRDFWNLLKEMESRNQLPPELFILEIGVGMGKRAALWLDTFHAFDRERGTNYYPRLRFLLGDYSLATLDRCRPAVQNHVELCSFIALDALDPIKTLSFLRHKILHVHSTNMYDNLPDEEIVWRDNKVHWVQVRAYLSAADAARIEKETGVAVSELPKIITRLLEVGPECLPDRKRGVVFWQEVWKAFRLEERLVGAAGLPDLSFPAGLTIAQMEDILQNAPNDLRFHLSSGALDSFRNTLPLLHPKGYLQVQDIFVTDLNDYSMGFHGPGKLGGSIVNWVNGALLREVGERAGYDLHFAPFQYRKGSNTSVLRTTRRE